MNSSAYSNVNSKMCAKILQGKYCDKKNCGFAHSVEQLAPICCAYDRNCRNFSGSCKYFHPSVEDKRMFLLRQGINSDTIPPLAPPPSSSPVPMPIGHGELIVKGSLKIEFEKNEGEEEEKREEKKELSEEEKEEERKLKCLVNNIHYDEEIEKEEIRQLEEVIPLMTIVVEKKNLEKVMSEIQKLNIPFKLLVK